MHLLNPKTTLHQATGNCNLSLENIAELDIKLDIDTLYFTVQSLHLTSLAQQYIQCKE